MAPPRIEQAFVCEDDSDVLLQAFLDDTPHPLYLSLCIGSDEDSDYGGQVYLGEGQVDNLIEFLQKAKEEMKKR